MNLLINILKQQFGVGLVLTFNVSPCAFCIPMLLPELFFFSIFGCQPFASPFPSGVYVCFGERGKWRGELQRANSVQDFSMAYLVISQSASLPSFKMWLSVLGIPSLLHSMSLHDFQSVTFLLAYRLKAALSLTCMIILICIHFHTA